MRNTPKRISILGTEPGDLTTERTGGAPWFNVPGALWIDVPPDYDDDYATVVKIERDEELDVWVGSGMAISMNNG